MLVWVNVMKLFVVNGPKGLDMVEKAVTQGYNVLSTLVFVVRKMIDGEVFVLCSGPIKSKVPIEDGAVVEA